MPRTRKIHPSLLSGDPAQDEAFPPIGPDDPEEEEEFEDDDNEEEGDDPEEEDGLAEIRRELAALRQENAALRQSIPPSQPRQQQVEPEEEPNWEELIFSDPNQAMKLHGERVARQVESKLRAEYQREQSSSRFWNDFYKAHGDLKEDHDLVEATLSKNFSTLANIPVADAIEQLADLTRQRILRYSGKAKKSRKRPTVEGSTTPRKVQAPAPKPQQTTLIDLIKARKERRQRGTAA